jgi:xanthine dehydrogenase/oxidase
MYKADQTTHFLQSLQNWHVPRLYADLQEVVKFPTLLGEISEFNARNKYRKRGASIVPTKFGISFTARWLNQAGALVHIYTDGTVLVTHGGTEMGQVFAYLFTLF